MEREAIGAGGMVFLIILILLRIPVALAMLATALLGTWVLSLATPFVKFTPYLAQFKTALWNSVAQYDLSVIPLFILMGFLASESGLSRDLFEGLTALTRRVRGGVAMATILACGAFGAVSGSSVATTATMSRVALPQLRRLRYDEALSTGVLAAGGTLGILIPPSVALVLYAVVVEASIIDMFRAAILPGLLAMVFFVFTIWLWLRHNPELAPAPKPMNTQDAHQAIRRLLPVLIIFGGIILGLGFGLFTPTPAAAVGVFLIVSYGVVLRFLRNEGLTVLKLRIAMLATARTSAMIYFILFAADLLKGFFARSGLPAALSEWVAVTPLDPYQVLITMLVLLILLGCFMESLSMILVIIPFFWPVLIQLNGGEFVTAETASFGLSTDDLKIWFGIIALIVVELGLITPPVGLNVFVIRSFVPHITFSTIFRGITPFFMIELMRIALLLACPAITLVLII